MSAKLRCEICEKEFDCRPGLVATKKAPRYCSRKCMGVGKMRRTETTCASCGNKLNVRLSEIREHNFCDMTCYAEWQKTQVGSLARRPKKPIDVQCANCGKSLKRIPAKIKRARYHFCNTKCHGEWRKTQTGALSPRYDNRKVEIQCAHCGKKVAKYRCRIEGHELHFCTVKCQTEWRKTLTGALSPRYKGGSIDYYGPNWKQQCRSTRKRDGYCCQGCGKNQKDNRRSLDVHHIIPFRTFSYIPDQNDAYLQANALSNLVTLCPSCHSKMESGKLSLWRPTTKAP